MGLSFIDVIWSMFAGISLAIGLVYLIIWFKQVRSWSNLAFFFVASSIAAILIAELLLLHAKDPMAYGKILRWAHIPVVLFIASSIVFLQIYLKAGRLWLACTAFALRLLATIVNFLVDPNLNYNAIIRLRTIKMWGGEVVSVAEGVAGTWQFLGTLSAAVLLAFLIDMAITCWRRSEGADRRRAVLIGGSYILVVATVGINAALMHWGYISQPFYLFATFMLVVVAIGNELSDDIIFAATTASELKRNKSELRDSMRRLDLASAAAAVGAWEWDYENDKLWASDQARVIYGMSLNEPLNYNRFLSALHAEDSDVVGAAVMKSLKDGLRFQREYRIQRADGSVNWVMTIGRVEAGTEGRPVLRGISVDISARKLAAERFRDVVEAAPTGMLILDFDGKILLLNAQVEKDFGYSRSQLIGQPIELLIPERFHAGHVELMRLLKKEQTPRKITFDRDNFCRHKDGHEIPVEVSLNAIQNINGVEILATITNISEHKKRKDLLIQERAFLRQIIDISPGMVFAKDRAGRFTLVNEMVAQMYGTTVENMIGKTDADFNSNTEEVAAFRRMDMAVMDTLQKKLILEETITDAQGNLHWLQTVKLPVLNDDGSADQLLGVSTDIGERKKRDLDLAQQRNELAHLSRVMMLSELSGSLAHELNQPLAAILTNAQAALRFLARDNPNLDEIREILRDIVSDDRRAGEVIQGLRLLLKKGEMQRESLNANALVESVLKLLRSDMLNAGVAYSTHCTDDLPPIHGIGVQLQQVLLNLMVNGCDAMATIPRPERRLVISTALSAENYVIFCVRDQGPGVSAEYPEEVFAPFFTTKAQGLGLGLAVCRKLIDAHGGRIWVSNNEERGASFYFSVPVSREV